jgi:DNA-binding LytR/AlgR family response regulator
MIQGLETVYYRFIMPSIRKEIEGEEINRHLVVGGEKVDLSKLLHIEAREHHVYMTFEDAKSQARARLSDIVAQTQDQDGMQPHRSWWIARDPAIRVERKNGRLVLRLRDDTEVPVARTRVDEVLSWLQTHVHPAE